MAINEDLGILLYSRLRRSPYFYASGEQVAAAAQQEGVQWVR